MSRKIIIVATVILLSAFTASAFAQKSGRSGGSHGKGKHQQKKNAGYGGGHKFGSGQHHFNRQLGRSQHHFSRNSQLGRSQHHFGNNSSGRRHNGNAGGHFGNHHRHSNQSHANHGHRSQGHYTHNSGHHFYKKYHKAQRYFVVRSNLYLVQFHQFPYDVCWHNGKYWVCYEGYWMPYSYLIQNHAGAWNWHQTHYRYHNHSSFKKNFKNGNAKLTYGK